MAEMTETLVQGEDILTVVGQHRGMLWEKIAAFGEQLLEADGTLNHKVGTAQSKDMEDLLPLKQTLEGGLYTRELFMPKGIVVVSMIHKQQHPSFLLQGKVSYITDEGEIKTITGPHTIFTQVGTQRVLYIHEDTNWCCVYKTNAKTFEEAEADVYTDNYKDLPQTVITKRIELCQEH